MDQYASIMPEYASISLKRGTHLTFNGIIVFILTFCLHKVLIKCVSIRKSFIWFCIDSSVQQTKYYGRKVSTLRHFLKKYFLFILNIIEIQYKVKFYFNTRVPTQVNTNIHESTRVNTSPTRINTSPTRVNTNQHRYYTSQHESMRLRHESPRMNTSPTRVNTNQHESDTS